MSADLREQLQATLGASYALERELGGGGMSRVFTATETRLKRKVVVKVLSPELSAGVSAERFEREIQLAASLQQANIVPLLSAGDTNGLPYFTMPLVEGESLRARLGKGALSITEVVGVLRDVARALSYAHERGVVHRDIKPDNVLLSHGTAVVTDFGIAKALSASRTESPSATLTQLGTSIGTPAYMAPEQAAGETEIDHRADIYAFGCMAYELLAGQTPFHGRTPTRTLAAHMSDAPRAVHELRPDTPPVLADLIMRCLAKDPNDRPQSANDIAPVLDTVTSSGSGMQAMPSVLLGGAGMLRRALVIYVTAFVIVTIVAKAAIIAIGLPAWVFPGALIVMSLGLPVILFTAYVQRATRRVLTVTPTLTTGGRPAVPGTMATMALKASPHVSWRRTAMGGAYALGAFVLLIGGYMLLRALGIGPEGSLMAAGKLSSRDRVLIADFDVKGADSSLGAALTQALRTQLEQSSAFAVMPASEATSALELMRLPAATRLTLATARELAQRSGVKAVVAADAAPLGGGFLVSVKLVNAGTGDVLASYQETAPTAAALLGAIDAAARKLRARAGESLKSVNDAPALEQAATSSLDALRKYAEGVRANDIESDYGKAVSALREAVALDSTFGIAYRKLSVALGNAGAPVALGRAAIERAFLLRDRMPPRERANAMGQYYQLRPYADRGKAYEAYAEAVRLDEHSYVASGNLSQQALYRRNAVEAERLARLSLQQFPGNAFTIGYLINALVSQGRVPEAARLSDSLTATQPSSDQVPFEASITLPATGRYDSALVVTQKYLAAPVLSQRVSARLAHSSIAWAMGRVAAARRDLDTLQVMFGVRERADSLGLVIGDIAMRVSLDVDRAGAIALADRAVAPGYFNGMPVIDRPYLALVTVYARAGDASRARSLLARYDAEIRDSVVRRDDAPAYHAALGEIALAERTATDAIREFRLADVASDGFPTDCAICLDLNLGRAYDLAQQSDSAIVALERYLQRPYYNRFVVDQLFLGPVLKRLGELHEAKGAREKALTYYTRFTDLWKGADPELQPTVAEAKRRIAQLAKVEAR